MSAARDSFFTWLTRFLKDRGYIFAKTGSRVQGFVGNQAINSETGIWANDDEFNKPKLWILHVDVRGDEMVVSLVPENRATNIGIANVSSGNSVGLCARIVAEFRVDETEFERPDNWTWNLLFLTPYPVGTGGSAEIFQFNPANGVLSFKGDGAAFEQKGYIFASLLGLRDPNESVIIGGKDITYGAVTQKLREFIHTQSLGGVLGQVEFYDLAVEGGAAMALRTDVGQAFEDAPAAPAAPEAPEDDGNEGEEGDVGPDAVLVNIEPEPDLLGIDQSVYDQINAALKSGKQHLMFYGPPGTGKTTIASWVAVTLGGDKWTMVTGSADWSSQDIIGGYQPIGDGQVRFIPGVLLKAFDQPFIIDELNRCDIDKVLGPLFTVLSGQHTSLPYRVNIAEEDSPSYVILPEPKVDKAAHEYAPGVRWRLLATINSIDKASLYQMSYALSRRFGWIYVDAPQDKGVFVRQFMAKEYNVNPADGAPCPLAAIWDSVNKVRVLGPAPFIDAIRGVLAMDDLANLFEAATPAMSRHMLDAFDMFVLPLMDGILKHEASELAAEISAHLGLVANSPEAKRIESRLSGVAV
jgi:5-methylcytosine-specific restriction enzyme B